jgi:hypothetical protein
MRGDRVRRSDNAQPYMVALQPGNEGNRLLERVVVLI